MKNAVQSFIEEKASQKDEVKIGLVAFNQKVSVIGDGSNKQGAVEYREDDFENLLQKLTDTVGSA